MKIALVGPHGAGKTTLAMHLSRQFGSKLVPEFARSLLKRTGLDWRTCPDDEWLDFQAEVVAERLKVTLEVLNGGPEAWVMDRTLKDVEAYLLRGIIKRDLHEDPLANTLLDICRLWAPRLRPDLVLFYRYPGWHSPPDGQVIDSLLASILPASWNVWEITARTSFEEIFERVEFAENIKRAREE